MPAKHKGRRGSSRSPLAIVLLLVAVTALVLYFERGSIFGPETPGTATDAETTAVGEPAAADSGATDDEVAAVESESLVETVAEKIVERIEEKVAETINGSDAVATAPPLAVAEDEAEEETLVAPASEAPATATVDPSATGAPEDVTQRDGEPAIADADGETATDETEQSAELAPEEEPAIAPDTRAETSGEDESVTETAADSSTATGDEMDAIAEGAQSVTSSAAQEAATATAGAPEAPESASDEELLTAAADETAPPAPADSSPDTATDIEEQAGAGTASDDQDVASADAEQADDSTSDTAPQAPESASDEELLTAAADETAPPAPADSSPDTATDIEEQAGAGTASDDQDVASADAEQADDSTSDTAPQAPESASDEELLPAAADETAPAALADSSPEATTTDIGEQAGAETADDEQEVASADAERTAGTTAVTEPEAPESAPDDDLQAALESDRDSGEEVAAAATGGSDSAGDSEQQRLADEIAARVAEEVSDLVPSPDPAVVAEAAAEVAQELGLDVATLAQAVAEAVVDDQAESFLAQLVEQQRQAVDVDAADHFVTSEQILSLLPEDSFELTTREKLLSDPELEPHTPITVVREVEEIQIASPARVIASAGGDLEREIKVLQGDEVQVKTLEQLLTELIESPGEMIKLVSDVKYFDVTTLSEFAARTEGASDETLRIIKGRYTLEAASVAELLRKELDLPSDVIFYLRTVRPEDEQGIWGIVQDGLAGNFARGMAIRYGQSVQTYQVEIPEHADEILPDQSSSFLGRLIHAKTDQSYVYNFKRHRMGRNPDRIHPGQEIVIINFTPEELISIFKHFVEQRTAAG